jgi:hypothetical protein
MSLVLRETSVTRGGAGSSVLEKTSKPAPKAPTPFGAPVTPVQGQPSQAPPAQPTPAPAKQQTPPAKQ